MSCKTCEVLNKQVEYLQALVDKLLEQRGIESNNEKTIGAQAATGLGEDHDTEGMTMAEGL